MIVPGTLFFAAGVMVLRSAGAEPDWLGLWLPGACLTGIGIGLAFPTLGSAAVRDVPDDRFATASAVNAAFRQVGAVLGTAILVAIVGEPASLAEALSTSPTAPTSSPCSPRSPQAPSCSACEPSERQARSAVPTPTVKLRSPAAISIVLPPTSPIGVAPRRVQRLALAAEQEAAGALAEERLLGRAAAFAQRLQVDPAAEARRDRATRPERRRGRRR